MNVIDELKIKRFIDRQIFTSYHVRNRFTCMRDLFHQNSLARKAYKYSELVCPESIYIYKRRNYQKKIRHYSWLGHSRKMNDKLCHFCMTEYYKFHFFFERGCAPKYKLESSFIIFFVFLIHNCKVNEIVIQLKNYNRQVVARMKKKKKLIISHRHEYLWPVR